MVVSRWTSAIVVSLVTVLAGCGGGDDEGKEPGGNSEANATGATDSGPTDAELLAGIPIPPEKSQTPMDVMRRFLAAVREGDDDTLGGEALLTHTAILANKRAGTEFAPPGSPNAQFAVIEQELLSDNKGAHVLTQWTDPGDPKFDVAPSTMDIIWVLRKEDNVGWGVMGAMFKPFPDMKEPVVLDFEDPADFEKTIAWINEEGERRALRVATAPQNPPINRGPVGQAQGGGGVGQQPPAVQNGNGGGPPLGGGIQ
ncbi:MAG: hypothetical protein MPJ50_09065 [Pirellulales bacterium]|nr:hypothetical protein [Pirellulales bacterium]